MEYKDYYKTLGVDRSASQDEIKHAYRKLAMQYHPDRNPGDASAEEKFKEINEAQQVLGDVEKRARYDQLGASYSRWQQQGGQRQGGFNWEDWMSSQQQGGTRVEYGGDIGDIFGEGGFSDFFTQIFGGMGGTRTQTRRAGRAAPPRTYESTVNISLQEAFTGATRAMQVDDRRIEVKIPPGAKTGTRVRMAGAGPVGPDGRQGDIFLQVEVAPDARYEREGDDLITEVTTDLYTAVLGGQVTVPTPAGNVMLTIPAGTQPGQTFRLAKRGMPKLRNPQEHGDLFARVKVRIPRNLTEEQRKLFEQLRDK
jgi:curved DNA-binding protein